MYFFPQGERKKEKGFWMFLGGILTAMFESWRVNQASGNIMQAWPNHGTAVMSTKTNNVTAIDGALSSMIYFSI